MDFPFFKSNNTLETNSMYSCVCVIYSHTFESVLLLKNCHRSVQKLYSYMYVYTNTGIIQICIKIIKKHYSCLIVLHCKL